MQEKARAAWALVVGLLGRFCGAAVELGEGGETLVVELELEPSAPFALDRCGTCTRCLDACPTGALPAPRVLDANRCVSYLTIEHRDAIPLELREGMGALLYGCDICQEVCPHNSQPADQPPLTPHAAYASRLPQSHGFKLIDMLNWTEEIRRTSFGPSALKRASHEMFRRNALIAAANAIHDRLGSPAARAELLQRIEQLASDGAEPQSLRELAGNLRAHLRPG